MTNAWAFKLRGDAKSETLEIDVYDIIGDSWYYDSVSAKSVRALLKANKTASTIKLRINSEGGDVFDGWAIYNLLCEHPARVEADIDALAASSASVVAMAADEIRIASNAFVMIHNAWGGYRGEADDLRRWADVLEKMSGQAADIYTARTGQAREKIVELMNAETWMTAAEAKALGFVDKVMPLKTASTGAKKAAARAFASMRLDDYSNVPESMRAAVEAARKQRELDGRQGDLLSLEPSTRSERDPSETERKPMKTKVTAQALGISESATEDAFEAAIVAMAAEHKSSKDALKAATATIAQIEEAAGVTGAGLVGAVKAGAENGKKLEAANATIAAHDKAAEDEKRAELIEQGKADGKLNGTLEAWAATQTTASLEAFLKAADADDTKRKQLIAQGKADGKLVPAQDEWIATQTTASLEAFLKVAPRITPAALVQPPKPGAASTSAALTHEGKSWEQMSNPEKRALHASDTETYNALLADYQTRNSK